MGKVIPLILRRAEHARRKARETRLDAQVTRGEASFLRRLRTREKKRFANERRYRHKVELRREQPRDNGL